MQRTLERALDRVLSIVTLLVGVAIGLVISPRLPRQVAAQAQAGTQTTSGATPTLIPLTGYVSGQAFVSNVLLAHELEADHAVVNGYDLLLLDQNIVNYLAKLPVANGPELTSIGERSRATTRYTLPSPPKATNATSGGPDVKQAPK